MLCTSLYDEVPSYKRYRNEKLLRRSDKIKNKVRQIMDCSLKDNDKKLLLQKMISIIQEQLDKK